MVTTVKKWGNSQGIRLPKHVLDSVDIKCGDDIVIEVDNKTITLRKATVKKIDALFADYDGDYVPEKLTWDAPVGHEVW